MLRKQSRKDCGDAAVTVRKDYGSSEEMVQIKCGANAVPLRLRRRSALLDPGPEEVGHTYGPARNSVSRMVSEHCAINVETAVEMRFCTCPAAGTKTCRSTILGSQIVEMELYFSCVSVALGSHNFAARAS